MLGGSLFHNLAAANVYDFSPQNFVEDMMTRSWQSDEDLSTREGLYKANRSDMNAGVMPLNALRGVEWVHDFFLFPLVLGKMKLPYAKLGLFCVV